MKSQQHLFNKSSYKMNLHEELIAEEQTDVALGEFKCRPLRILRVHDGWIYYNSYITDVGVFVPDTRKPWPIKPGPRP